MVGLGRSRIRDGVVEALAKRLPLGVHTALSLLDDQMLARASRSQLVSLDVFDTVLVRPLRSPDHAFLLLGGPDQRRHRIEAERLARRTATTHGRAEVTLAEIHQLASGRNSTWDAGRQEQRELDVERSLCRPHSTAAAFVEHVRAAGARVVFISDTYLSEDIVRDLLGEMGRDAELIVSSEFATTKRAGSLFDLASERLDVDPARWMHIGDTLTPDVIRPRQRGIQAGYVPRPIDQFRRGFADLERRLAPETELMSSMLIGLLANELAACDPAIPSAPMDGIEAEIMRALAARDSTGRGEAPAELTSIEATIVGRATNDLADLARRLDVIDVLDSQAGILMDRIMSSQN